MFVSEFGKAPVVIEFPSRYFDDPRDEDAPVTEVGLWADMHGMGVSLEVEIVAKGVYLDHLLGYGCVPKELFYLKEEFSEERIRRDAERLWRCFCPKDALGLRFFPARLNAFVIYERNDEVIFGSLMKYRYKWDDEFCRGDISKARLILRAQNAYEINLTPYDV